MLRAPEARGSPWGVLRCFNPKMKSSGEDLAGLGWTGLCGTGAVLLTAEMPRRDRPGAPGLILAPLGFYLTTSILGKLPLGKYREGSGVGGGWDRCWGLLDPSEHTQSFFSALSSQKSQGIGALWGPCQGSTGLHLILVAARHSNSLLNPSPALPPPFQSDTNGHLQPPKRFIKHPKDKRC